MELSFDIQSCLNKCGSIEEVSSSQFKMLIDALLKLTNSNFEEQLVYKDFADEHCRLLSSLCLFIAEAAKYDMEPSSLYNSLDEFNWNPERINLLQNIYENKKQSLRWKLASCTTFPPQIVDINWKVDFISKDNTGTSAGSISYMITLQMQNPNGEASDLTFRCSLAELTHLVTRLKQASRCVQRFASQT